MMCPLCQHDDVQIVDLMADDGLHARIYNCWNQKCNWSRALHGDLLAMDLAFEPLV